MSRPDLSGRRVLVVEDEYLIAVEVCEVLDGHGAEVIGPVGSIEQGREKAREGRLDGAVLDVNIRGEMVFSLADELKAAGVPSLFVTGCDRAALPEGRRNGVVLGKPVDSAQLASAVAELFRTTDKGDKPTEDA